MARNPNKPTPLVVQRELDNELHRRVTMANRRDAKLARRKSIAKTCGRKWDDSLGFNQPIIAKKIPYGRQLTRSDEDPKGGNLAITLYENSPVYMAPPKTKARIAAEEIAEAFDDIEASAVEAMIKAHGVDEVRAAMDMAKKEIEANA